MFRRDYQRFGEARRACNQMPLGSGALAGSGFKLDRAAIAADPNFAPAYGILAVYMAGNRENLPEALTLAKKATNLQPGNSTYQFDMAEVLLAMNRIADARMVGLAARKNAIYPEQRMQAEQFLVCSTGVIGRLLPMPVIEAGFGKAAQSLGADAAALDRAAHAILTTDTRIKVSTRTVTVGGAEVRLTGFAKGAAMIGPNMATMLAFVLTDAAVSEKDLTDLAPKAARHSFNAISVEGHTSTNDTLLFLANGPGKPIVGDDLARFQAAATEVCAELAKATGMSQPTAGKIIDELLDALTDSA